MKAKLNKVLRSAVNILGLLALVSAFVYPESLLAVYFAALVLGFAWYRSTSNFTAFIAPRMMGVGAVVGNIWMIQPDRYAYFASALAFAGTLAIGNYIKRGLAFDYLATYNLEVHRSLFRRLTAPKVATKATNALGTTLVLVAFIPDGWAQLGVDIVMLAGTATVLGVIGLRVLDSIVKRRNDAHVVDADVMEAVERLQPRFIFHFAGMPGSQYHINMWLPFFDEVPDPYLIVVRDAHLLEGTAEITDTPIVYAPRQAVLEQLLPETVRACFYSNHAVKNAHLIRNGDCIHVQLMHGDSDKAISRSALALMYDQVYVAGQAGVDRYHQHGVDIPNYKFRIIGRPQLHEIEIGERFRATGERPVVLYTPTWAGMNSTVDYSSLSQAEDIVDSLLRRDVDIMFRTHPYTGSNAAYGRIRDNIQRKLADDAAQTGKNHRYGAAAETDLTLAECINLADVAVSDVSGTASDWLYSAKPFAMTDPQGFEDEYEIEFPISRASYLLRHDLSNLEEVLDELLDTDSKKPQRERIRSHYLSDIKPEELISSFVDTVRSTYATPVVKDATAANAGI